MSFAVPMSARGWSHYRILYSTQRLGEGQANLLSICDTIMQGRLRNTLFTFNRGTHSRNNTGSKFKKLIRVQHAHSSLTIEETFIISLNLRRNKADWKT